MAVVVDASTLLGGRYRLDDLIGVGGMGRVYRGLHTGINRPVAIKILTADGGNPEEAERFRREAFATGQLDHPNIVAVSDVGVLEDGAMFLVMELLEGESLAARLARDGTLPWPAAIGILRGMLGGAHYAHQRDIVHCDLKPDNIFLATKHDVEVVKLLDFGIARLASHEHEDFGLLIGTPAYLSPEQALNTTITPASDIYSASVVLYELLTGKPPFRGPDVASTLAAHISREPPWFEPGLGIPSAVEQLVRTGLAKEPSQRFTSAAEFQARLEAVLVEQGPRAGASLQRVRSDLSSAATEVDGHVVTLTNRVRHRRWLIATIVVAAAGAAIATVVRPRAATQVEQLVVPVPVARPAPSSLPADPRIEAARIAIAAGRITAPPGANALELIRQIAQDRPHDPRIGELHDRAADALRGSAELLWSHGRKDSAGILYGELLVVVPGDRVASERSAQTKPAVATTSGGSVDLQRVRWLVTQIDLAILERRFVAPSSHNALEYLVELRRLDPANAAVRRLSSDVALALTRAAKSEPDQAEALLAGARQAREPMHSRDPSGAAVWVAEGDAAVAEGRYGDADTAYKRAIAADHTAHAALAGLAEVAYNRGDFARSALSAKAAVASSPRSVGYRMALAKAYFKLLRYDDAIAQWQIVLDLDPANSSARKHIELARTKSGR